VGIAFPANHRSFDLSENLIAVSLYVQAGNVLIIDYAPRASEVAKKHDEKDGHQGFSDHRRHKLA
jgi:hypothetical protein